MKLNWLAYGAGALVLGGIVVAFLALREPAGEPATPGNPTAFRRLTEAQYARSIRNIFGDGIEIPGRFEPPLRAGGLIAIGSSDVVSTPFGIEQYELKAREIAGQIMSEERRAEFATCGPEEDTSAFDEACARTFLGKYGRLLYRRPLSDQELGGVISIADSATEQTESFYSGLSAGLAWLLVSPNFTYRVEVGEPDPDEPEAQRFDAYSMATRISFLLWDGPPDEELLDAAASGALHTAEGIQSQVERMVLSPRFEDGVRAFFSDKYAYEYFDGLHKDQSIFPRYTSFLANDAQEQSLMTIVDFLVKNKGDYRDLFTTKKTFMNRSLAALYNVELDDAGFEGWIPYTFAPDDKRQGVLLLAGFLMQDPSHEGRSSPTIRGKMLREQYLCQTVPLPPGDVDFSEFEDPANPDATVRERLNAHRENPTCAGCHAITDPIGLGFENFDAIGQYRSEERGEPIVASEEFDGVPFADVVELQNVLRDNPSLPSCLTQRVFEYAAGRSVGPGDREWLEYQTKRFADNGYVLEELVKAVVVSEAFQAVEAAPDQLASK
jgi:hypothetical protein